MKPKNMILRLRTKNPLMNSVEIAKKIGVSKQYVHSILKKNDLVTNVPKPKKHVQVCLNCDIIHIDKRRFCSDDCRFKYTNILVECSFCHVQFYRKRQVLKRNYGYGYKQIYCSHSCMYRGRSDGL